MTQLRVLVVDDSLTIRAMIDEILSREPNSSVVGFASDAEEALTLVRRLAPNVITLDLRMPGMDGFALEELRAMPHAPVVVVSSEAQDGSEVSARALALGAQACFDKGAIMSRAHEFVAVLRNVATNL